MTCIFEVTIFELFFRGLLRRRYSSPIFYIAIYIGVVSLIYGINSLGNSKLNLIANILIYYAVYSLLYEEELKERVFYFTVFFTTFAGVEILCEFVLSLILGEGYSWENQSHLARFIVICLEKLITFVTLFIIKKKLNKQKYGIKNEILLYSLVLPIATFGIYSALLYSGLMVEVSGINEGILLVGCILLLFANAIIFFLYEYIFRLNYENQGKSIAIFSLSSYEDMVKKKETLSNEEVIYISQNNSEDFKPLEGKKEIKIYFNSEEADYKVKDSRWEIIFGENVSSKLENILVISDYEFKINAIDKWSLWYGDRNNIKIKKGVYVWKRTEAIEIEQKNDQYVLILVCIIGIFLILEGQGIILIKQVVNHSSITNKYKLFFSLGMSQKDRKKYFFHEIKNIAFYPTILGCVRGILVLGIIYFYQEGEFSKIFIYYLAVCVLILLIQYGSYYCIAMLMAKLYKIDSEPQ